ncbi:MAG: hypothetical protein A2W85_13385 [Bacteroidetes bacterium GWF2_41_31]|nr:MAG: hypothetical protein A2W85_13385 [Bacteroidetes bacterium GWF2_41_31]OFZ03022.1 MAG: hypothetical protein A2338_04170 [Bacteroidetes bacterium RIFOXYB12_FULL_41_6]
MVAYQVTMNWYMLYLKLFKKYLNGKKAINKLSARKDTGFLNLFMNILNCNKCFSLTMYSIKNGSQHFNIDSLFSG